ncbi:RNA-dependent RNA polymerase [Fusarium coeruleum mitovirus 1]|uniref:RNA-dependent RNA polymerase n=1 Tax=Fusarium coeruleum mitovirus 1 TaxID=1562380 RepID=A0A0C6F032_9VIRU|nr:RNA-dependent RNA polymerase [Fusarium coeruleum mitovirus 1]BAQ36630.1 RNA-dependent RNA polymerase [Fusarium coeruleum mitovirus 1]
MPLRDSHWSFNSISNYSVRLPPDKWMRSLIKNYNSIMKNIKLHLLLVKRLITCIFNIDHTIIITLFIKEIYRLWDKNGFTFMIKYMKSVRLHITRYICKKPIHSNSSNVSVDKSGFPSKFLYLKPLIKEVKDIKILLTLLSFTRGLKPSKKEDSNIKYDLSSITSPFKGTSKGSVPQWFIKSFVETNKLYKKIPEYSVKDHYLSTKGGPCGKSTWSSTKSHLFYKQDLILNIQNIFREGFKELFFTPFLKNMHLSYGVTRWPNGKLSIVKDPEGKRRVIAMVDYHSQLALKSIHNDLLDLLSKFKCDRTFTQDPLHNWSNNKESYFSLDLSSATDRFPVELQKRLLAEIYQDDKFATNWMELLLNRDYIGPGGEICRYSVGQPMGAYSSWAAFTLTHHLVVSWSAYKALKTKNFDQYIILGDDIVIKNNEIANIYRGQMMRMGVDISMPKTHISKDTYEFAKRWIKDGKEISGIPLKGLINNIKHLKIVYTIINDYLIKVPSNVSLSSWLIFEKIFVGFPIYSKNTSVKRYISRKYIRSLKDFALSVRFSMGLTTPYELRQYLSQMWIDESKTEFKAIPNENIIRQYFEGILVNGLADQAKKTILQINDQLYSFEKLEQKERKSLVYSGVIFGLMNRLTKLEEQCTKWKEDESTIVDILNFFSTPSVDSLSRKDRDCMIRLDFLDSLWKKSFKKHFSEQRFPDSYYRDLETKTLYGSLDSLDITSSGIEVRPIWNTELKRFNSRSIGALEMFISDNE